MRIEPIDATLGAIVSGVDLARLDASSWASVEDAFHRYALLVFVDQHLSSEAQVAFARRFGEIEHLFGDSGIVPISNQKRDGELMADDELPMQIMRGNEGWHTDSSYMPISAKASVLSAHVVPASGGQTEWADMRAAYQSLDERLKARVADLSAYHSIRYSQARIGHTEEDPKVGAQVGGYGFDVEDPPLRPLVKVHPVTERPALYIGRHAYGIPGLEPHDSQKLLDELMALACQSPRTYRHAWRPGDVAIWDNRCVLHRACPYDHREARFMKHTRIAGDPATESAPTAP